MKSKYQLGHVASEGSREESFQRPAAPDAPWVLAA